MASPEKKRRLTEEGGDTSITVTAPSRPPLKKRFTSLNVQPPAVQQQQQQPVQPATPVQPAVAPVTVVAEPEPMMPPSKAPMKAEFSVRVFD